MCRVRSNKDMLKERKGGFSIVELLVVLVILVIIVYVAYNIIVRVSDRAKVKAFQVSVNNIENWVIQQYEMYIYTGSIMAGKNSKAYLDLCDTGNNDCFYLKGDMNKQGVVLNLDNEIDRNFIVASGNKPDNYSSISIFINEQSKKACIMAKISVDGEFFYNGIEENNLDYYKSLSCGMSEFDDIIVME